MAEHSEVIKQFKRMCKSMTGIRCTRGECPMGYAFGCENIGQCRKIAFERPDVFEEKVMAWAAENPEPVYPTIAKYLEQFGIIIRRDGTMEADFFKANEPMSTDVAKLLGIDPKESV